MLSKQYKEFLKSEKWNTMRHEAYRIFNYKCWFCEKSDKLNLHHTKYFKTTLGKSKKLFKNNMRWFLVVCSGCHKKIHDIQKKEKVTIYDATCLYRDRNYPKKKVWITRNQIKKSLLIN